MAAGEALVPFFDHSRVAVAHDLCGDVIELLNLRQRHIESWSNEVMVRHLVERKRNTLANSEASDGSELQVMGVQIQNTTRRHSVREAAPEEVGARPANSVLDRVGQDAGDEHGEQKACSDSHGQPHVRT